MHVEVKEGQQKCGINNDMSKKEVSASDKREWKKKT